LVFELGKSKLQSKRELLFKTQLDPKPGFLVPLMTGTRIVLIFLQNWNWSFFINVRIHPNTQKDLVNFI
jgi:hypothetical protein